MNMSSKYTTRSKQPQNEMLMWQKFYWPTYTVKALLLVLILIGILPRVIIWFNYEPIVYNDTNLYAELAGYIQQLDFDGYNGERTPGYPLWLLLGGLNYESVWLMQSFLGILISVMLFGLGFYQTKSTFLAFLIGLSYALSINQIFFEAAILTETLGTFLLILSLSIYVWMGEAGPKKIVFYCAFLGIVVAWAILTRRILLIIVPVYFFFLIWRYWGKTATKLDLVKYLLSYILPTVIVIFGWSLFNKVTINYFGLTTLGGYSLTARAGRFIELMPDEYSVVKETYIETRQKQLEKDRGEAMVIWRAIPEMIERTGLSYAELSAELNQMSRAFFIQHPTLLVEHSVEAWFKFWEPANYWIVDEIKSSNVATTLKFFWYLQFLSWIIIKYLFWIIAICHLYMILTGKYQAHLEFNLLLIGIVISTSVVQAVVGSGDNHRFSIPFDPLILYVVLVSVWYYAKQFLVKKSTPGFSNRFLPFRHGWQNAIIIGIAALILLEFAAHLIVWDRRAINYLFDVEIALLPDPVAYDHWDRKSAAYNLVGRLTLLPDPLISEQQVKILETWPNDSARYMQFDPILGWSIMPNMTAQTDVTLTSNSMGIRGLREYPLEPVADMLRIATFGSCATFGCGFSDEDTWQAQLEQARPDLEAMNWGVEEYGLDQSFLRYQHQGASYQPDIVIIGFEEDILQHSVNRFLLFYDQETNLPLTKPIFVESEKGLILLENPFGNFTTLSNTLLNTPDQLLDLVCPQDVYCDESPYRSKPLDIFNSFRLFRTVLYEANQVSKTEDISIYNLYVQRINLLLTGKFVEEISRNGSLPVVLIFPERQSIEIHERGEKTLYQDGITLLQEKGIQVIDLAPAFAHAKRTESANYLDYYTSDGRYFNQLGNYIVSQTVIAHLCKEGILGDCS